MLAVISDKYFGVVDVGVRDLECHAAVDRKVKHSGLLGFGAYPSSRSLKHNTSD
jgi:hypothetical protein